MNKRRTLMERNMLYKEEFDDEIWTASCHELGLYEGVIYG
jgi:hypothetical protein